MEKKKVLLAYGYGLKNAGDMAITLGAIELLNKSHEVTILSRFDSKHPEYEKSKNFILSEFPDVRVVASPFKLNRNAGITTKIKDYLNGGLQVAGIVKDSDLEKLIDESDLVVFNGGNLFRCESFSDFARLSALMYPLKEAQKNNIPYIVFPQSASTINRFGKKVLKNVLKDAEKVWTREDQSFDYLRQNFELKDIDKTIDLAFFIKSAENSTSIDSHNIKNIAVTVRGHTVGDLKEFKAVKRESIINKFIQSLRSLDDRYNVSFHLIIQTEKDRKITTEIFERLKHELVVDLVEEYDPIKLMDFYSKCNLLIGMRLHSIIMALSTGTPATGFFDKKWGLKNPGMMEKFDLPYLFIDENAEQSLADISVELLKDERRLRKIILNLIKNEEQNFHSNMDSFIS